MRTGVVEIACKHGTNAIPLLAGLPQSHRRAITGSYFGCGVSNSAAVRSRFMTREQVSTRSSADNVRVAVTRTLFVSCTVFFVLSQPHITERIASAASLQRDTTVVLGRVERDLTGDGELEILRVVGVGPTIYDLGVTFTVESAGKTIYRYDMRRMTRTANRHVKSRAQYRAWIKEFGRSFFLEKKFMRPQEYVDYLRRHARRHIADIPNRIDQQASDAVTGSVVWEEMQNSPITIFTFSPGGDTIEAIGWNVRAGRFYSLLSCC
jgi:hypothetical protein